MNTFPQFESSKTSQVQSGEIHYESPAKARYVPVRPLTDRQRQIVACVAADMSNRQIAQLFEVSPKTINQNMASIRRRIGKRSRVAVALWWVSEQMLAGATHVA